MYTSYIAPPIVDPSVSASAAPNTPAMAHMNHPNTDSTSRLGQPPTPSPSISAQQAASQHVTTPGGAMNDLHLSASEARIYPGMISRRQRTGSIRQSSAHESDERAATRQTIAEAVDEGQEGDETETKKE